MTCIAWTGNFTAGRTAIARYRAATSSSALVTEINGDSGGLRFCLISERRRLASSRRRLAAPASGLVGRRGIGGMIASLSRAARRSWAAARLRCCERCSEALIVSTVPFRRSSRCVIARRFWTSVSADVCPTSKLNWTRESVVLTLCPPGPEERENCSDKFRRWNGQTIGCAGAGKDVQIVHGNKSR